MAYDGTIRPNAARRLRLGVPLLVAMLLTSASGCGFLRSGGSAAARELPGIRSASRALLGSADDVARQGRAAQELADRLASQADEFNRYGKRLTAEDRSLITSLRTSRTALLQIQAARGAADMAVQLADSDAVSVARSAIRGAPRPSSETSRP